MAAGEAADKQAERPGRFSPHRHQNLTCIDAGLNVGNTDIVAVRQSTTHPS